MKGDGMCIVVLHLLRKEVLNPTHVMNQPD